MSRDKEKIKEIEFRSVKDCPPEYDDDTVCICQFRGQIVRTEKWSVICQAFTCLIQPIYWAPLPDPVRE